MKPQIRILAALAFLASATAPAGAQSREEAQRAAIEAMYPVMIKALAEGRFDEARELCSKAKEWEPKEPTHSYNLACIEAKAGNPDAAFAALEESLELGYSNLELLDSDPDLESLRQDARFERIRERLAGGIPAPPGARKDPAAEVAPTPASESALPVPASITEAGPVGLYFMTRYWSTLGSLEKVAWYFLPDGRVYRDIHLGFSEEELTAHTMEKGRRSWEGELLVVTWSDGTTEKSEVEIDADGHSFFWSMGNFTPVEPIADPSVLAGTWSFEAGKSTEMLQVHKFKELKLSADGTFLCENSQLITVDEHPDATVTSTDNVKGKWSAGKYSLTMSSDKDGSTSRRIAFTIDKEGTPGKHDWLFHGGTLYTRK